MKMKRNRRMACIICVLLFLVGCAAQAASQKDVPRDNLSELTPRGTMIFNDEYEFVPPPSSWEMLRGSQFTHYVVGFYRRDLDKSRMASSFIAYDEEPYGTSIDLEVRAQECLKRYFWASMLQKNILEKKKIHILGGDGLAITFQVKDPSKKLKVQSKLVFGYRGKRVVLFYLNQWRAIDSDYDSSSFELFNTFVESFTFLKRSFYETL